MTAKTGITVAKLREGARILEGVEAAQQAAASNTARQLRYQRNRRDNGQVRRWFWLDAETLALYDRLLRAYGYGGKEKMMADALVELGRALDAQGVPK